MDSMLYEVDGLSIRYNGESDTKWPALSDVGLSIHSGEKIGIVGESGSGKTTLGRALIGLLPDNAKIESGEVRYLGKSILLQSERSLRELRGKEVGWLPQDPLSSLNPVFKIGFQLREAIRAHSKMTRSQINDTMIESLKEVKLPDVKKQLAAYPHELSGGMRQRVLLAQALILRPKVLIADEPTTGLDATVQAQVLDLLQNLVQERKMALVLITHDLAVASEICDRLVVFYSGQIVESGPVSEVLSNPIHPYTKLLLAASRHIFTEKEDKGLADFSPHSDAQLSGCHFRLRCPWAMSGCEVAQPLIQVESSREVRCLLARPDRVSVAEDGH